MRRTFGLVEFRNYRIREGRASEFARYFDGQGFPEALQKCGVAVLGQFEVVDHPDRFVWIRAFERGSERGPSLDAFYSSQFWKSRRFETNQLLLEYDNVFLLRPDPSWLGANRTERTPAAQDDRVVLAVILYLSAIDELTPQQSDILDSLIAMDPTRELARLVSAEVDNDYPRLPLREEPVFVWLVSVPGPEQARTLEKRVVRELGDHVEVMMLRPTANSLLR
ncbi:MAG TPA: hypothetical protein VHV50_04935 [Actinomycetota bacterium]|jgi:hypothetical protein|nr:hypothetical protein [Actinomycetota bacterium]